jgi:hypothetical protein
MRRLVGPNLAVAGLQLLNFIFFLFRELLGAALASRIARCCLLVLRRFLRGKLASAAEQRFGERIGPVVCGR